LQEKSAALAELPDGGKFLRGLAIQVSLGGRMAGAAAGRGGAGAGVVRRVVARQAKRRRTQRALGRTGVASTVRPSKNGPGESNEGYWRGLVQG